MRVRIIPVLLLGGCIIGSQWELDLPTQAVCLEENKRAWFDDTDQDGWGSGEAVGACAGSEPAGSVRNELDCDPADGDITGAIGAICPSDLVTGGAPDRVGILRVESEYVATYGDTGLENPIAAETACRWWGLVGHLATIDSDDEWATIRGALEDSVGPDQDYAGFIGVASDGVSWGWSDDSDPAMLDRIGFCAGRVPDPAMYDRLAVLRPAGESWCLGLPDRLGGEYTAHNAHFICERPTPDPALYQHFEPME